MPLLVTGNFYTVTFLPPDDAAWAAAGNPTAPALSSLAVAINKAAPDPVAVYIIDASSGLFVFVGGQAFAFDDSLINGAATAGTTHTLTATDSTTTIWATSASGVLYQYDQTAGVLRQYSVPSATAFKAFLP